MSMEVTAWNQLYNASHAQSDSRPFSAKTLRRIWEFARPHRGELIGFLLETGAQLLREGVTVENLGCHGVSFSGWWLVVCG